MSTAAGHSPSIPDDIVESVYSHLRAIAQLHMNGERSAHTLTATALVHEALLRLGDHPLSGGARPDATNQHRLAFLSAAGEAMRRILIEHARRRSRIKRGGDQPRQRIDLDAIGDVADLANDNQSDAMIALDEAFGRLERHGPRLAHVVRLRFFAGLSIAETASALGISERTVNNDWAYARAWLSRDIRRSEHGE